MRLGQMFDRMTFWNMPSFVKSYELGVYHLTMIIEGVEVWYIPGRSDGPTVLFCHGNAGNLRFPNVRRDRLMAIHETGAHLWAFDYSGYGASEGTPSEESVYANARTVHRLAHRYHNPESRFVLFGRSLGGAVATYLATEVEKPDLLILESTFTSVADVAASWSHPRVAGAMTYEFNSAERMARLRCPLKMIHGTADRIVPYSLGEKLYECCPTHKEWLSVAGAGHNNVQQKAAGGYETALHSWLNPDKEPARDV